MSVRRERPLAPQIAFILCSIMAVALAMKVELQWRIDQSAREAGQQAQARGTAERMAEAANGGILTPAAERLLRTPMPGDGGEGGEVDGIHLVDRLGVVTWSTAADSVGHALAAPPLPVAQGTWVNHTRSTARGRARSTGQSPRRGGADPCRADQGAGQGALRVGPSVRASSM